MRLICGENRISRLEWESQCPGCWGAGWGQSRAWAPSAGHQAACTPWEAQAREWSFLEFDELLQEDSRGKVERGRVRGRRFL